MEKQAPSGITLVSGKLHRVEVHAETMHAAANGVPRAVTEVIPIAPRDKRPAGSGIHVRAAHRPPLLEAGDQCRHGGFPGLHYGVESARLIGGGLPGHDADPGDIGIHRSH